MKNTASVKLIEPQRYNKVSEPDFYTPFIKYFEGYRYNEIASSLNISVETAKARVKQAQQVLKNNYNVHLSTYKKSD